VLTFASVRLDPLLTKDRTVMVLVEKDALTEVIRPAPDQSRPLTRTAT